MIILSAEELTPAASIFRLLMATDFLPEAIESVGLGPCSYVGIFFVSTCIFLEFSFLCEIGTLPAPLTVVFP